MNSISDIVDVIGGSGKLAIILGVKPSAASEMKRRDSIPVKYWPKLVDECRAIGVRGVNYDSLVSLHQKKHEAA